MTVVVREPEGAWAPVVASLPHGGEELPERVRSQLACAPEELVNVDWHTPLLYDFLGELGVASVEATLNRYVVDANRDPSLRYGDFRRAAVAAATPWGLALYDAPPGEHDLAARIEAGHTPYHAALDRVLERALAEHGRVLLLDLHSFGVPLGLDVVVGDRSGTTAAPAATALVHAAFEHAAFRVGAHRRFPGGWIVRRFAGSDDVDAVMVELHYACYLRPDGWPRARPRLDPAHLDAARERLRAAVGEIVAGARLRR